MKSLSVGQFPKGSANSSNHFLYRSPVPILGYAMFPHISGSVNAIPNAEYGYPSLKRQFTSDTISLIIADTMLLFAVFLELYHILVIFATPKRLRAAFSIIP